MLYRLWTNVAKTVVLNVMYSKMPSGHIQISGYFVSDTWQTIERQGSEHLTSCVLHVEASM